MDKKEEEKEEEVEVINDNEVCIFCGQPADVIELKTHNYYCYNCIT